jgi:hypothetical protein
MAEPRTESTSASNDDTLVGELDYSSPGAANAMRIAHQLILEIHNEVGDSMARKVQLYERTLGLAVIPVLIRRLLLALLRQRRSRRLRAR